MARTVEFKPRNWLFEIYDKIEDIKIDEPTITLYVEPFPEGHNSIFPYKVLAAYYFNNPMSAFNNQPLFEIGDGKEILILRHNYKDVEHQLTAALILMKNDFGAEAYDSNYKNI